MLRSVDIGGVRGRLAALGVTLSYDDDPTALAAQLQAERQYRAALYIQHLDAAQTFLTQTLAGPGPAGLGNDYPFVAQALAAGSLLDGLAKSLDHWICPAVEDAMDRSMAVGPPNAPTTYTGWFDDDVFDPHNATYQNNVTNFFASYPITANALTQIAANFQNNLETACRRIIADKAAITALFSDRYFGLTLSALTAITSTGSDFHKGGQQVLILTFATRSFGGFAPFTSTLQLVYKPADLELDCLVAGESAAVNRATGAVFMQNSLVEIVNTVAQANPAAGLEQLPTYRILPRNPTSALPAPTPVVPLPVRQAYGYIEYLGYSLTGLTFGAFNYYPLGASDYLIFQSDDADTIVESFYHQVGQFLALAVTFSLQDLHVENVRTTTYRPHLIDLEICLTTAVANITQTLLFFTLLGSDTGGINGSSRDNEDFVWTFTQRMVGNRPRYDLGQQFVRKWYQNRLWALRPNKRLVRVNAFWLLQGLQNGMNVLRAAQNAGAFAPWFARLANVLVRVVPFATSDWNTVRDHIYVDAISLNNPPVALAPTITEELLRTRTTQFNQYQANPTPEPKFVALVSPQSATDLTNFDIPVFYHRVGSTDLLDSTGQVIPVPAQVSVYNAQNNQVQANTNVGRATYFAAPPTAARIQNGQLAALTGGGFAALCLQWQNQVLAEMHLNAVPANPGILVH